MRRNNFWIGALTALATFIVLSAFVGRRHGWHRGWRNDHYRYERCHHRSQADSTHAEKEHPILHDSSYSQ